jgi:hypothetical protein
MKTAELPTWLTWNVDKKAVSALRAPTTDTKDLLFDLSAVIEFYKR